MLVCFWSPKGGSGTSVVAAACARRAARGERPARASPTSPATSRRSSGSRADPGHRVCATGCAAGPEAPTDALDGSRSTSRRGLTLLPSGAADLATRRAGGGRRARRSRCAPTRAPTIVDVGVLDDRGRAQRSSRSPTRRRRRARLLPRAAARGAHAGARRRGRRRADRRAGRALGARDVADVLGVPVLATVVGRASSIARVPSTPVCSRSRLPDALGAARCASVLRAASAAPAARAAPRDALARAADAIARCGDTVHRRLLGASRSIRATARAATSCAARLARLLRDEAPLARTGRAADVVLDELVDEVGGLGPLEPLLADPDGHRDHGERPGPRVRRARRPARARSTLDARRAERSCGSPSGSSRRSVCASIARRRWSTRASPTARGCTRCSRRSRPTGRASRSGASRRAPSRSTRSASTRAAGAFLDALVRAGWNIARRRRDERGQDDAAATRSPRAIDPARAHRHDRGDRRAARSRSRTSCGSKRGPRTPKAPARSACASSCAPRCACGPTGSSSARCAAARRSTCCRRSTPVTTVRCRRCTPTARPTRSRRLETLVLFGGRRAAAGRGPRAARGRDRRDRAGRARGATDAGRSSRSPRSTRPGTRVRAVARRASTAGSCVRDRPARPGPARRCRPRPRRGAR